MEALIRVTDKLTLKVEGNNQLELFAALAENSEIFGIKECGCCKGSDIRYVVRTVDDPDVKKKKTYTYYELHCQDFKCKAKFQFGIKQDAEHLFPKRKNEDGSYIPNNGWVKYVKPTE